MESHLTLISAFFSGVILSFGLIIPLGIQNTFVFNNGVASKKIFATFPVSIVASFCDAALIMFSVFGVTFILSFVQWLKPALLSIGICFLMYLAVVTWKSSDKLEDASVSRKWYKNLSVTIVVSLLNPHAILDTFFVIGSKSSQYVQHQKISFMVGCILIDLLWFLVLGVLGCCVGKSTSGAKIASVVKKVSSCIMAYIAFTMAWTVFHIL